jgi:hypothetical protein
MLTVGTDPQLPAYSATSQTQTASTIGATSNIPATLDQFRRNSTQLTGTPISTPLSYAPYTATSYTPQMPQYSYYSQGFGAQPAYASYQHMSNEPTQRDTMGQTPAQQPHQSYRPMGSQPQQYGALMTSPGQPQEPGDNSDGGVPVNTTF